MSGKIFPGSDNIYQDQAKILFDYYRQSAEKIVQEEERIEGEIAALKKQVAELEEKKSKLWIWFLFIVTFFVYFIKKSSIEKSIAEIKVRITEFEKMHDEIFRDYKVTKLGVAYVPVADQVKYNDKSFIVDYTETVPNSEVTLQVSRQNDLLIDTIGRLENLATQAPIVETSECPETISTDDYSKSIQEINQNDYLGGLERSLRTISYCMDDLDITSVSLPLVANNSEQLQFLNDFATNEVAEDATVINVFNKERFSDSIDKFQELNKLKDSLSTKTQQFEDVLKGLMTTMAYSVQTISALKLASVDKVVFESNRILFNILKSPYNHYSPLLEYEEIERIKNENFDYSDDVQNYEPFRLKHSSRVKYNILTGMWTSEDGNNTNMPFGVHQLHEEIVAPVVQNLMNENRIERLRIYNHIKDQKISYLNKWHQDTEAFYRANRAESADIINLMQESLREYVAAYNTLVSLKRTEDSMSGGVNLDNTIVETVDNSQETLVAFELQSQEFQKTQDEFEDYMERLKEDIDLRAERFGHVEYYDAKLRDGYSNEVAVAASEVNELDNRRKPLAIVNPLFAKTSSLLPEPSVEDVTFEHIAINLPIMAKNALSDLEAQANAQEEVEMPVVNEEYPVEENYDEETVETENDVVENGSEETVAVEENAVVADNEETVAVEDDVVDADEEETVEVEDDAVDADEEETVEIEEEEEPEAATEIVDDVEDTAIVEEEEEEDDEETIEIDDEEEYDEEDEEDDEDEESNGNSVGEDIKKSFANMFGKITKK